MKSPFSISCVCFFLENVNKSCTILLVKKGTILLIYLINAVFDFVIQSVAKSRIKISIPKVRFNTKTGKQSE